MCGKKVTSYPKSHRKIVIITVTDANAATHTTDCQTVILILGYFTELTWVLSVTAILILEHFTKLTEVWKFLDKVGKWSWRSPCNYRACGFKPV